MRFELIADIDSPRGFRQIRPKREAISLHMVQIPRGVTGHRPPEGIETPEEASGIYFLLDDRHNQIYIGESYHIFTRCTQHQESWWTHAICFFVKGDDPITEKERNWLEKELHSLDFGMQIVSQGHHSRDDMAPVQVILDIIINLSSFFGVTITRTGIADSERNSPSLSFERVVPARPTTATQWAHEICSKFFDVDTEEKRREVKTHFEGLVRQHITHYVQRGRGECKPGVRWKDRYRSLGILGTDGRVIELGEFPWPLQFVNYATRQPNR